MECRRMHFFAKNRRSIDSFTNWPIDPPSSIKNKAKKRPLFFPTIFPKSISKQKKELILEQKRGLRRHVKKCADVLNFEKKIY